MRVVNTQQMTAPESPFPSRPQTSDIYGHSIPDPKIQV